MIGRTRRTRSRGRLPKPIRVIIGVIVGLFGALLLVPSFVQLNCRPGQAATAQYKVLYGSGHSGFRGHNATMNLESMPGRFECRIDIPCQIEETNQPTSLGEQVDLHYIVKTSPTIILNYRAYCGTSR